MIRKATIIISVLTVGLAGIALPVQGFSQEHSFFNSSNKYREWFHETIWVQDLSPAEAAKVLRRRPIRTSTAARYPYPEKDLVLTEKRWREAFKAIEAGKSNWFDVEVIRQHAGTGGYGPAMNFLAWMYEGGRGWNRDFRKAFMWYERAKLSGQVDLRGNPAKIFERLKKDDKVLAQLQLTEDIERLEAKDKSDIESSPGIAGYESIRLHVLKEQRETAALRKRRRLERKKAEEANR